MALADNDRLARLDRAFELVSVVPLGGFVLLHSLDYGRVLVGAAEIGSRRSPSFVVVAAEALFVWLPLFGHALFSLSVWKRRKPATDADRPLLLSHRLAGVMAGLFLLYHFVRFRLPILRGDALPRDSVVRLAAALSETQGGVPWIAAFHLVGIIAVAFHLGAGLLRIAERSERLRTSRAARASSIGAGVVAGLVGVLTILRLAAGA